jgi:hypothetical protein
MINFVAFVFKDNAEDTLYPGPPVSIADTSAFASLFTHWEPEVRTLIEVRPHPRHTSLRFRLSYHLPYITVGRKAPPMGNTYSKTLALVCGGECLCHG